MAARKITFSNFNHAAQNKSMWVGNKDAIEQPMLLFDGTAVVTRKVTVSDAVLKCIDEILVNSIDMLTMFSNAPPTIGGPVTRISCAIDPAGAITISNNGPGFEIVFNTEHKLWDVEAAHTREHSGSNIEHNPHRITGGTNGLGLKLITNTSEYVAVETYNAATGRLYKQRYTCASGQNITAEPPAISDVAPHETKFRGTSTTFMPNYALLCRTADGSLWIKRPHSLRDLQQIVHLRMLQVAAWCDSLWYVYDPERCEFRNRCQVLFQGRPVACSVERLGSLTCPGEQLTARLGSADATIRYPWTLAIALAPVAAKHLTMSIVNGVAVTDFSHLKLLLIALATQVAATHALRGKLPEAPDAAKKMLTQTARSIAAMLHCTDARYVPDPQFDGQTKSKLPGGTAREIAPYKFAPEFVEAVWKLIKTRFERMNLSGEIEDQSAEINRIRIRKHEKAELYGRQLSPAEFRKMFLDLGEGDAALLLLKAILAKLKLQKYHGTYSLGGVPPNTLKQIRKELGPGEYLFSKMLQKNVPLQGLAKIIGLEYGTNYGNDAAYYKLRYAGIIIGTDQDADGIGQIASLVVLFILVNWPELFDRGFVRRYDTPIVRVRTGPKALLEFYDEDEYEAYAKAHPEIVKRKDAVKYYKGLAGHTKMDTEHMARHFMEHLYTYTRDDAARASAEIMYGKSSAPRKLEHMKPELAPYTSEDRASREITISTQMMRHAKMFQREMYSRKLPHAYDGMIPAQRMAFACIRETPATTQKIYQWSGKVANDYKYAHGDMSLNGTIIKMAQNFPGSNNLPKLLDDGAFGGLKYGRGVAGSPRYISTKLNSDLAQIIFPAADDDMLPYVYAEGKRTEPQYYVGIIPMAVLETTTTAAAGWNVNIYARKLEVVLAALRLRILARNMWAIIDAASATPTAPTPGRGATLREVGLAETRRQGDVVIVSRLPTKMWSEHVRCHLLGEDISSATRAAKAEFGRTTKTKSYKPTVDADKPVKTQIAPEALAEAGDDLPYRLTIADVFDRTDGPTVDIHIVFRPGAIAAIEAATTRAEDGTMMPRWGARIPGVDAISEYCGLYSYMSPNLNLISGGIVHEFQTYSEIAEHWYQERLRLYTERYERTRILNELQLLFHREMLRYILASIDGSIVIGRDFEEPQRIAILEKNAFPKFDRALLFTPTCIPTAEIRVRAHAPSTAPATPDINYKYIDDIKESDKSLRGIDKIRKDIAKLEAAQSQHSRTTPKSIWLSELDKIMPVVTAGRATGWSYKTEPDSYEVADVAE